MSAKQKYKLAFHTIVDPTTFVVLAGVAGAEQYNGTYLGYGPGIEGYGKRYGAALADSASGRIIGSAVLPSLFHQDPRYFYQGSGGIRSRTWHALTSALVTRGDSGKLQPNYSHLLGNLAAGGIANAYHPESSRGLGLTRWLQASQDEFSEEIPYCVCACRYTEGFLKKQPIPKPLKTCCRRSFEGQ